MNAAAWCLDVEVVSFLISNGARVSDTDEAGKTALHHGTMNTSKVGVSHAVALLKAGADPRVKDKAGNSSISDAKKKKNAGVLGVLEAWTPPPPDASTLETVRASNCYEPWRKLCFAAVDAAFDSDAAAVELLAIAAPEEEDTAHAEVCALMADLETAYRSGSMGGGLGGGSFRQCAAGRIPHDKIVSKLSKLSEEQHVVVVFCAEAKREGVSKKVAKYNEKSGERIAVAWAARDAYPIAVE
jgi:hypothetical protein